MTAAQSYVTYTGDGVITDFNFSFPYLEREHIIVLLDEVETTAFTFAASGTIRLDTAPANGVGIVIRRQTPKNSALLEIQTKSTLKSSELNAQILQTLYASQEAVDTSELIRAGGLTIPSVEDAKDESREARDLAIAAQGSAETAQTASEAAQILAEAARDTATGARDVATSARDQAQAAETAAESARDIAMGARDVATTARDQAQAAETASESARDLAISARDTATTARDQAQAAQGTAETARDDAVAAKDAAEAAATPLVNAVNDANAATLAASNAATLAQNLVDSLDQVDNTSDAEKPVSNATQTALDGKLGNYVDTWLKSSDGKNRLLFSNNGWTHHRSGHAHGNHRWETPVGHPIMHIHAIGGDRPYLDLFGRAADNGGGTLRFMKGPSGSVVNWELHDNNGNDFDIHCRNSTGQWSHVYRLSHDGHIYTPSMGWSWDWKPKKFEYTISSGLGPGAFYSLTHGLGGVPQLVTVKARFKVARSGYSAGEEIIIAEHWSSDHTDGRGLSVRTTPHHLHIKFGVGQPNIMYLDAWGNRSWFDSASLNSQAEIIVTAVRFT